MEKKIIVLIISFICAVFVTGCGSNASNQENFCYQKGSAAFYALEENGILTSNNEHYDVNAFTAAHENLPYGTKIKVTDLNNGRNVIVTINDHNMPEGDYIIKLSKKAANELAASIDHEYSIDIINWG